MKKYLFGSIYFKFVCVFIGILWISGLIAFWISISIFAKNMEVNFENEIDLKSKYLISLNNKYSLTYSELMYILENNVMNVKVYDSLDNITIGKKSKVNLSIKEIKSIENEELVTITYDGIIKIPYKIFKLDSKYIVVTLGPSNKLLKQIKKIIKYTLYLCAFIGSILVLITVRMIVKPIKKLSNATKEVAKGNFDIEIIPHSIDELGQLEKNFNLMTKELKNKEFLQKDFISNVSHEFKTPMTSIQGFAKLIKNKNLPQETFLEYVDIIISETGRLANLSSSLLNLTELENKVIHNQFETFSVDEQLREVILLLENDWTKKNIDLILELDKVIFHGNKKSLHQVWINLLNNAIKFSNISGQIKITLKMENEHLFFSIEDTGIGISDVDKERVFEKFFKSDRSRTLDGNGLGLSIVKKIIENCNGKIYFKSTLNKGTTFYISL
jgi:signal transduction histidine kinase